MIDTLVTQITSDMEQEVVAVYSRVFAGADWYEVKKCSNQLPSGGMCERAYPGPIEDRPDGENTAYHDGMACWHCGQPLRLIDFYNDPVDRLGSRIFADAVRRPGFIGFVARGAGTDLVGFTWGFEVPPKDTPSVKFEAAGDLLRKLNYSPERTFYAAEIGVVPEARERDIATRLAYTRFEKAREVGYEVACFRTIDRRRLLGLYGKLFGADNVVELFPDPNPAKAQVWFAAPLSELIDHLADSSGQ